MIKPIIFGLTIIVIAGLWTYISFYSIDNKLYREAKELEKVGDIYTAHDKITEALNINPKNRKVISYKTHLYFLVKNDSALKEAYQGKKDAEYAMEKGDYVLASKRLNDALIAIDSISTMATQYKEAEILQQEIVKDVDRVIKEIPERYYLKGQELYQQGELERAYIMLDYISNPLPKVVRLKDELAFELGSNNYKKALKSHEKNEYNINEAITWFSKVSKSSPDYKNAKAYISKLNNIKNKGN